jgi:hypothetical protein
MSRLDVATWLCLTLALATVMEVRAQQQATPSQSQPAQQPATPPIDVTKLPVAPDRLQRKLREAVEREEMEGLNLRYTIDVFAFAPRVQIVSPEDNLLFGPTRYSSPTREEMWNMMTPQEFRSPIMDFSNLARWLQDRSRSDK